MYAAAMQGNLILANASSTKSAAVKKAVTTAGKRKGASKMVEDSNAGQETVSFVSRDHVKSQIRAINEELPDEILDLITDNVYRYCFFFRGGFIISDV